MKSSPLRIGWSQIKITPLRLPVTLAGRLSPEATHPSATAWIRGAPRSKPMRHGWPNASPTRSQTHGTPEHPAESPMAWTMPWWGAVVVGWMPRVPPPSINSTETRSKDSATSREPCAKSAFRCRRRLRLRAGQQSDRPRRRANPGRIHGGKAARSFCRSFPGVNRRFAKI